jgi:acid phosphatase type 7
MKGRSFMSRTLTALLFASSWSTVLSGAGCGPGNSSGDRAAERLGDLSNPGASRRQALLEIGEACPLEKIASVGSPLLRRPYLQQVTAGSAEVLWAAAAEAGAPEVVITDVTGTPVARVEATADALARPSRGGRQWRASLGALSPDTIYCYAVEDRGTLRHRAGFRTAPLPGAGVEVRFVAFGDSGDGSEDQSAVLAQLGTVPFQFLIHTGDVAYGVGARNELEEYFFDVYDGLLGSFPVFPTTGNHDYGTEDALPFREAFSLPENGGEVGRERWYSFDWGDVHFVALDSEKSSAPQAAWLDADLAASRAPWKIVYLHRPPYSSGDHGSDATSRRLFAPIFEKHGVQLVLAGHDHHYERSRPQSGVTYVVTGGGGVGTRPVGASDFTAFAESVLHFVYVTVLGDTLTLHAIDATGTEFDSLVLQAR